MLWPRLVSAATALATWFSLIGVGALAIAPADNSSVNDTGAPTELVGPVIPLPSTKCPRFNNGRVTFSPVGIPSRQVLLFTGKGVGGPLVIYWHGMGGRPEEVVSGLGRKAIKKILDQGGVVAAPTHDPASTPYPWYLVSTKRQDDLILTDEIVACAHKVKEIDPERIHTLGMSAGGLQATQLGPRRSNYIASVVAYSGGLVHDALTPPFQAPGNKFSALLFYGGPSDEVIVSFERTTRDYARLLRQKGHEALVCNHRGGHVIPRGAGAAAYQFFEDHPFRVPRLEQESADASLDYCGMLKQQSNARPKRSP